MTDTTPLTEAETLIIAAFGFDKPSTVKTETEIRVWREELRADYAEDGDIPSMGIAFLAAIDALTWVLGEDAR